MLPDVVFWARFEKIKGGNRRVENRSGFVTLLQRRWVLSLQPFDNVIIRMSPDVLIIIELSVIR